MTRSLVLSLCLAAGIVGAQDRSKTATLTGWFACDKCGPARLTAEKLGPTNPECARKCIEGGAAVVFLSEQGHELLKVKNYTSAKDDLGYHVELTGSLDAGSKTFTVQSVKRMEYTGSQCARPRKKS